MNDGWVSGVFCQRSWRDWGFQLQAQRAYITLSGSLLECRRPNAVADWRHSISSFTILWPSQSCHRYLFLQTRLYSPTFLALDKPALAASLERTDKLVVYSGWLHELHDVMASGQPIIFEVENPATGGRLHLGVLEFSNEQHGTCYAPGWALHALHCEDGSNVTVRLATLPRITALRLRPADPSFLQTVHDPRATLEETLRVFTAVTEGQTLVVHAEGNAWEFMAHGIEPQNAARAACLVGADCSLILEDPSSGDGNGEWAGGGGSRGAGPGTASGPTPAASVPHASDEDAELAAALAASLAETAPETASSSSSSSEGAGASASNGLVFGTGPGGGLPPLRPPVPSRGAGGSAGTLGGSGWGGGGASGSTPLLRPGAATPVLGPLAGAGAGGAKGAVEHRSIALGETATGELSAAGEAVYFTLPHKAPGLGLRLSLTSEPIALPAGVAAGSSGGARLGSARPSPSAVTASPALGPRPSPSLGPSVAGSAAEVSLSFLPPLGPSASAGSLTGLAGGRGRASTSGSDAGGLTLTNGAGTSRDDGAPSATAPASHSEADLWVSSQAPGGSAGGLDTPSLGAATPSFASNGAGHAGAAGVGITRPGPLRGCVPGWSVTNLAAAKELTIPAAHPAFPLHGASATGSGVFYVGVTAFGGPVRFTLTAEAVDAPPSPSTSTAASPTASAAASAPSPDTQQCGNCGSWVPSRTFPMHEGFCRRNNVRCDWPGCGAVLQIKARAAHVHCGTPGCAAVLSSADDAAKHMALLHGVHTCDACGMGVPAGLHATHAAHECARRRQACVYCGMSLLHSDAHAHESMCGGRTTPCDVCGKLVARKIMPRHLALEHGLGDVAAYAGSATPASPFVASAPSGAAGGLDSLDLGAPAAARGVGGGSAFGGVGYGGMRAPARPSNRGSASGALSIDELLGAAGQGGWYDDGDYSEEEGEEEGEEASGGWGDSDFPSALLRGSLAPLRHDGDAVECPSCGIPIRHAAPPAATMAAAAMAATVDAAPGGSNAAAGGDLSAPAAQTVPSAHDALVAHLLSSCRNASVPAPPWARRRHVDAVRSHLGEAAAAGLVHLVADVGPGDAGAGAPPTAARRRRYWGCPCCAASFPAEDEAVVHLLTEQCPAPWGEDKGGVDAAVAAVMASSTVAPDVSHIAAAGDTAPLLGGSAVPFIPAAAPSAGATAPPPILRGVTAAAAAAATGPRDVTGGPQLSPAGRMTIDEAAEGSGEEGGDEEEVEYEYAPQEDEEDSSIGQTAAIGGSAVASADDDDALAAALAASLVLTTGPQGPAQSSNFHVLADEEGGSPGVGDSASGGQATTTAGSGAPIAAIANSKNAGLTHAGSGSSAPAGGARRGDGAFTCPSCAVSCGDMEALQVHMLTECPHAAEHATTMFG